MSSKLDEFKKLMQHMGLDLLDVTPTEVPPGQALSKPAKMSASAEVAADFDNKSFKILLGNQVASAVMGGGGNWEVQVYPDEASVLHFQARRPNSDGAYTRWYLPVDEVIYEKVKAAYDAGSYRKSFFHDSSKQYMICEKAEGAVVDIPGFGPLTIPQLFGHAE
jgi:hypothetical protein